MTDKTSAFGYRIGSGFLIALGLVIPGVSGAIIAMILGLYEPLIAAIAKPFSNWRQNLQLIFPLSLGVFICLLLFSRVLEYLFGQHPLPTLYFFFGLVLGSLPAVIRLANQTGFRLSYIVSLALGSAVLLLVTSLPNVLHDAGNFISPNLTTQIIQGSLVGVGLVIPGLSASFLLIAFGYYEQIIGYVAQLNVMALAPLALGFVPAIILASQGIHWLFKKQHGHTSYAILGLLAGSLWVAFPGWPRTPGELLLCTLLFGAGLGVSSYFNSRTQST